MVEEPWDASANQPGITHNIEEGLCKIPRPRIKKVWVPNIGCQFPREPTVLKPNCYMMLTCPKAWVDTVGAMNAETKTKMPGDTFTDVSNGFRIKVPCLDAWARWEDVYSGTRFHFMLFKMTFSDLHWKKRTI